MAPPSNLNPQKVLADLKKENLHITSRSSTLISYCRGVKDELIPVLLRIMREERGQRRLNASLLLAYLGDLRGTEGIIQSLEDRELERWTLILLTSMNIEADRGRALRNYEIPIFGTIDHQAVFQAIKKYLEDPEQENGKLALQLATELYVPEADKMIRILLHHPSYNIRSEVLFRFFAERDIDEGALDVAEKMLFEIPSDAYWVRAALKKYCTYGKNHRNRAAELLARDIKAWFNSPSDITNILLHNLPALKASSYPNEKELLEMLWNSPVKDTRRGYALERLSEFDGLTRKGDLLKSLSDPQLRSFAGKGLELVAANTGDREVVKALLDAIAKENNIYETNTRSILINALIAVGGDPALLLESLPPDIPPYELTKLYWLAKKLSPRKLIAKLVKNQVIEPLPPKLINAIESKWRETQNPPQVVGQIFEHAQQWHWFDVESGMIPSDYEELLYDLAKISKGQLRLTKIVQKYLPKEEKSEITLEANNETYHFTTTDNVDYYDTESVFNGLNSFLKHLNKEEQYILLYTGDQTATVIFAKAKPFIEIAHEFIIPLQQDFDNAYQSGVPYEKYVRQFHA